MTEHYDCLLEKYAALIVGMSEHLVYSAYPYYLRMLAPVVAELDLTGDNWVTDAEPHIGRLLNLI